MVDTLVLGTSANAWEFESLHAQILKALFKSVFFIFPELEDKIMIHPIYNLNYNNNKNINFKGLNTTFNKFSPFNFYMEKVFDRYTYISKNRWFPIDETIKPHLKVLNLLNGKNSMELWDINPDKSKKYIIFYHGLGQNVSSNQEMYKKILDKGYAVLSKRYPDAVV